MRLKYPTPFKNLVAAIGLGIGLCSLSLQVVANAPFKEESPSSYTVVQGDTLWGIAEMFLQSPWMWPEVWHINPQIENPHLIYPGDVISIVYIDGEPKLMVNRDGSNYDDSNSNSSRTVMSDGTLKLSPKMRISELASEIPSIPLERIQSFLVDHRIVSKQTLETAPYVIAGADERIILGTGDFFYARDPINQFQDETTAYGIYRGGETFFDPDTGENLGHEAVEIGLGKFISLSDDIAKVRLLETDQEIRINDRLLPTLMQKVKSTFHPKSPDVDINAKIIHVFAGVRNVSQHDVVVINKGERDQLQKGDVLATYKVGERVRDRNTNELLQLPSERSGLMVVFRTFEKVSFALIVQSYRSITVLDEAQNP